MSVQSSYARALFESAVESGLKGTDLDRIEAELDQFATNVSSSKGLRTALTSPTVTSNEKADLTTAIAAKSGYSELTTRFLALAARKDRGTHFADIAEAFTQIRLESEGAMLGSVVSADPLSESDLAELATSFTKRLGKKIVFKAKTDPALLAGLKVTVNGVTYDGSLRSQLYQLRDRLVYGRA